MVLQVKAVTETLFSRYLEDAVATKFSLKRLSLDRYMSGKKVAEMLHKTETELLAYMSTSHILHGALYGNSLLVHPESLKKYLQYRYKQLISRELNNS